MRYQRSILRPLFLATSIVLAALLFYSSSPVASQAPNKNLNANIGRLRREAIQLTPRPTPIPESSVDVVKVDVDLVKVDALVLQKKTARTVGGFVVCLAQSLSASAPNRRLNKSTRVSYFGIGNVRAGVSLRAAERAANDTFVSMQEASDGCTFVKPQHGPDGISFMVIDGKIARVDVENKFTLTAEGARVGDSEAKIKRLYAGRVRVTPHAYSEGHYLTVIAPDRRHGFVFETDGRRVTQYRAGGRVAIRYGEGCS